MQQLTDTDVDGQVLTDLANESIRCRLPRFDLAAGELPQATCLAVCIASAREDAAAARYDGSYDGMTSGHSSSVAEPDMVNLLTIDPSLRAPLSEQPSDQLIAEIDSGVDAEHRRPHT